MPPNISQSAEAGRRDGGLAVMRAPFGTASACVGGGVHGVPSQPRGKGVATAIRTPARPAPM